MLSIPTQAPTPAPAMRALDQRHVWSRRRTPTVVYLHADGRLLNAYPIRLMEMASGNDSPQTWLWTEAPTVKRYCLAYFHGPDWKADWYIVAWGSFETTRRAYFSLTQRRLPPHAVPKAPPPPPQTPLGRPAS